MNWFFSTRLVFLVQQLYKFYKFFTQIDKNIYLVLMKEIFSSFLHINRYFSLIFLTTASAEVGLFESINSCGLPSKKP